MIRRNSRFLERKPLQAYQLWLQVLRLSVSHLCLFPFSRSRRYQWQRRGRSVTQCLSKVVILSIVDTAAIVAFLQSPAIWYWFESRLEYFWRCLVEARSWALLPSDLSYEYTRSCVITIPWYKPRSLVSYERIESFENGLLSTTLSPIEWT